jgi:hypothetical protein
VGEGVAYLTPDAKARLDIDAMLEAASPVGGPCFVFEVYERSGCIVRHSSSGILVT